jgi:L-iditol 2-dehydrogenase
MKPNASSLFTMQALVLHAVGDVRYERVPRPTASAGQVLLRVASCGVCGSDIPRVFVKGTYKFPTICGHEFAGTVETCGPNVDDFAPGDRVAVFPLIWCGECPACELGKYAQCSDYDYLGSRSDGGFAEYVAVPKRNLIRVPEGVSLDEAAMTEPAAVALHAFRRAGGCLIGETVVVLGAGPVGLMAAQWARAMGASAVLLFDVVPEKLALAKRLGFSSAFDSRERNPVDVIHEQTQGRGAHVCVEAAGVPPTMLQALEGARREGRVVLLGNPSADVSLPSSLISQVMRREIHVFGVWNSEFSATGNDDDWRSALQAMATKTLNLEPLITHRAPLSHAIETLRDIKEGRGLFLKVLFHPE